MKKILFFFSSEQSLIGENTCMQSIEKYALANILLYEFIDIESLSDSDMQKYMEQYGIIIPPMICVDENVVSYDLVFTTQQLVSYLQTPKQYICLKDSILLYS